jgi:hypothetical protein
MRLCGRDHTVAYLPLHQRLHRGVSVLGAYSACESLCVCVLSCGRIVLSVKNGGFVFMCLCACVCVSVRVCAICVALFLFLSHTHLSPSLAGASNRPELTPALSLRSVTVYFDPAQVSYKELVQHTFAQVFLLFMKCTWLHLCGASMWIIALAKYSCAAFASCARFTHPTFPSALQHNPWKACSGGTQ